MIHRILKNENYVGNIIYNRTSRRLGKKQVKNPRHQWVRGEAVIDPIVDKSLFARAKNSWRSAIYRFPMIKCCCGCGYSCIVNAN
jgi:Recombinase